LIPDQYAFALQCGFSAIHIDDETLKRHTIEDWHAALDDFDLTYQRGYAVKAGPATSVFDSRLTALDVTLRKAIKKYQGDIVLATSMGVDSAVLLHMVSRIDPSLPVIFLDTGKHFRETLAYRDELVERFGLTDDKVNPLAYWTAKDVTQYMRQHDLPPHPLLALGYLSIGCQPCTTRVTTGEDPRAGRWRHSEKTECGIHMVDGKWVSSESKATFEAF